MVRHFGTWHPYNGTRLSKDVLNLLDKASLSLDNLDKYPSRSALSKSIPKHTAKQQGPPTNSFPKVSFRQSEIKTALDPLLCDRVIDCHTTPDNPRTYCLPSKYDFRAVTHHTSALRGALGGGRGRGSAPLSPLSIPSPYRPPQCSRRLITPTSIRHCPTMFPRHHRIIRRRQVRGRRHNHPNRH